MWYETCQHLHFLSFVQVFALNQPNVEHFHCRSHSFSLLNKRGITEVMPPVCRYLLFSELRSIFCSQRGGKRLRSGAYPDVREYRRRAANKAASGNNESTYHMFSSGICSIVGSSGSSRSTVRMYWLNSSRIACLV